MKKKILITGGLGFIGSVFTEYFLNKHQDFDVYVLDKETYAANLYLINEFKNKYSNFYYAKGDIVNFNFLDNLFSQEKFNYVVNFAAETSVDKSFNNEGLFNEVNYIGVKNLAYFAKKYNVIRFHQVSTDEVYGDVPLSSSYSFKEEDKLNPKNPYSLSKAKADLYLLDEGIKNNLDFTISRCTNNYGPRQANDKLIPLVIEKALNNKSIPLYGNGLNIRDWIYVSDHIEAIYKILFYGTTQSIYNISSHEPHTNREVICLILKLLNKDDSLITYVEDRLNHDLKYALDTSKVEKELGIYSKISFLEGIKKTIEFYKLVNDDGKQRKN